MVRLVILSILQSLFLCGGTILLKIAVQHMDTSLNAWKFFIHSMVLNVWFFSSGVVMLSSGLLLMYILRHYPYAQAYPLTSLSFVFGTLGAIVVFNESVSWVNWLGVLFILIGCFFICK